MYPVNRYIAKLTLSLNHAISVSLKRNPHSPNSQYIRAILLVKGVHFYGFHSSYSPFLKILIADPAFVNRTVAIMQSGTVMQTRFRVFEGHLSFPLQFMSDFGLYGCGWIDLGEVLQRGSEDQHDGKDEQMNDDIHPTFDLSPHFRQSRMPFEMDVVAHQILNRHFITARNIHHKLEIPAPLLPAEPLVLSVRELWEDERNRRRANGLNPSPEIPVDPSEQSRGTGGGWVAEARWWEEIRKRIERERETATGKGVEVKESEKSWEKWVMTTFESVEALWEEPWKVWKPGVSDVDAVDTERGDKEQVENPIASRGGSAAWNIPDDNAEERVDIDVDETMLSSQELSQLIEGEEAEAEWETLLGDYDPQPVGEEHDEHIYDYDDPHDPDDGPLQQDDTDDTDVDQNTPRSVMKLYEHDGSI
jgi:DNA polymerase zeta